jgi:hypothetical protein
VTHAGIGVRCGRLPQRPRHPCNNAPATRATATPALSGAHHWHRRRPTSRASAFGASTCLYVRAFRRFRAPTRTKAPAALVRRFLGTCSEPRPSIRGRVFPDGHRERLRHPRQAPP